MFFHLHLPPHGGNPSLGVDDEGAPLDAHVLPAVHLLQNPGAIRLANCVIGVREETDGEPMLLGESLVAPDRIWADAKDPGVLTGKRLHLIGEGPGLEGAPR